MNYKARNVSVHSFLLLKRDTLFPFYLSIPLFFFFFPRHIYNLKLHCNLKALYRDSGSNVSTQWVENTTLQITSTQIHQKTKSLNDKRWWLYLASYNKNKLWNSASVFAVTQRTWMHYNLWMTIYKSFKHCKWMLSVSMVINYLKSN